MARLEQELTPAQEASFAVTNRDYMEPALQPFRDALESIPADHPEAIFIRAYLSRWNAIWDGKLSHTLAKELIDIGKILVAAGRKPDKPASAETCGEVGDRINRSGFSFQETTVVMDYAKEPKPGAPLAKTAWKAFVMETIEHKTRREIVDALCDIPHAHDDHCFDRFRKQINALKKKLKKYTV